MPSPTDPRLVLEALSAHLHPSPLLSKMPLALDLYTHLQLLSAQLKSECLRALAEQEVLAAELSARGVPPIQWLRYGALNQKEGRRVKRWSERDKGGRMFGFSLEIRKHHLAKVFSAKGMIPERALQLLETYFPDSLAQPTANELYLQTMTEEQRTMLAMYRETTLRWFRIMEHNYARGLPSPTLDSMTGSTGIDALEVLARNMLKEAETVVRDTEDFEAIFSQIPPDVKQEHGVKRNADMGAQQSFPIVLVEPASHLRTIPGRQSLPAETISRSTRPPRERDDRRATIGHRPSTPAETQRDSSIDDTQHADPTDSSRPHTSMGISGQHQSSSGTRKDSSRRRSSLHPVAGPDYTLPIGHLGDNFPKELLKPFDGKRIKRSRASEVRRENADSRESKRVKTHDKLGDGYAEQPEDVVKRQNRIVLGDGDALGNSQSSEESPRTKEVRRMRKGKGRAV